MHMTSDGSGGVEVSADYASLARAAADLRGLAEVLADPSAAVSTAGVEHEIGLALEQAEHDWHAQRRRVRAYLTDAATGIEAAAQAYQQTDQQIAAAASGNGRGRHG